MGVTLTVVRPGADLDEPAVSAALTPLLGPRSRRSCRCPRASRPSSTTTSAGWATWAVARTPGRDWVHENQPVLTGFTVPVELVARVLALLPGVYHLRRPGQPNADQVDRPTPEDLRRVFDQIVASAT
jgi:hypothetical protein